MHSEQCWRPDHRRRASSLRCDIWVVSKGTQLLRKTMRQSYMNKSAITVSRRSLLDAGDIVSGVSKAMMLAAPSR